MVKPLKQAQVEQTQNNDTQAQIAPPLQKAVKISAGNAERSTVIPKLVLEEQKKGGGSLKQQPSTLSQIQSATQSGEEQDQANAFTQIDGIEYVNSEYLEDQEFNLDSKKRFYSMPDGTGRFETIERKKGISRSVLDKVMNRTQQTNAPIVLATSYVRLSEQDLASAFESDRCFLQNYTKKIKTLTPQKEVGLWPRKPLKEKFEYELVQLDSAIQYIQVESYSSSNGKPVYYWPLVIFLDEAGCIQEGVSGFKNNLTVATVLQHSAIQGVIKVPARASYLMMTPLASAVDVPEQELSNQGQIKLSVLQ
ncbi:putative pilus assembly protein FilE [Acinetobacter thutiue]